MNSSQSLNDPEYCHELDMSKCIIVLELTLQNIIYLPWYTETSTLCTKPFMVVHMRTFIR